MNCSLETNRDQDIRDVYTAEVKRPGYVLQGGVRHWHWPDPAVTTATIPERELHRHAVVEHRRPRH